MAVCRQRIRRESTRERNLCQRKALAKAAKAAKLAAALLRPREILEAMKLTGRGTETEDSQYHTASQTSRSAHT